MYYCVFFQTSGMLDRKYNGIIPEEQLVGFRQSFGCPKNHTDNEECYYLHHDTSYSIYELSRSVAVLNKIKYSWYGANYQNYLLTALLHYLISQECLLHNVGICDEFIRKEQYIALSKSFAVDARKVINRKSARQLFYHVNVPNSIAFLEWIGTKRDLNKSTDFIGIKNMRISESFKKKILAQKTVVDVQTMLYLYSTVHNRVETDESKLMSTCKVKKHEWPFKLCFFEDNRDVNDISYNELRKSKEEYITFTVTPCKVVQSTPKDFNTTNSSTGFQGIQWTTFEHVKFCELHDFYTFFYDYKPYTVLVDDDSKLKSTTSVPPNFINFYKNDEGWIFTRRHLLYEYYEFKRNLPFSLMIFILSVLYPTPSNNNTIYELELQIDLIFGIHLIDAMPDYIYQLKTNDLTSNLIQFDENYFSIHIPLMFKYKKSIYNTWLLKYINSRLNSSISSKIDTRLIDTEFWRNKRLKSIPSTNHYAPVDVAKLRQALDFVVNPQIK